MCARRARLSSTVDARSRRRHAQCNSYHSTSFSRSLPHLIFQQQHAADSTRTESVTQAPPSIIPATRHHESAAVMSTESSVYRRAILGLTPALAAWPPTPTIRLQGRPSRRAVSATEQITADKSSGGAGGALLGVSVLDVQVCQPFACRVQDVASVTG